MKAPDPFGGPKAHKLRGFIQSCQLIFHNDPKNFFSDRKKVPYSTSFLTGRSGKWIEPYLSNIANDDPSSLLNTWQLFETQLFTLFGASNEFRKAEKEFDNLTVKESDSLKKEDLILGYSFIYHSNPIINSKNGLILYDSRNKASSGIISSTSSDFATVLLLDEVFKEIKYFGEDVSGSTLHLFQGDMKLHPSSFHTSLKEKRDDDKEPEEIEAVLKKITSLTSLPKEDSPFILDEEAPCQFEILKEASTTATALSHFNPSLPTIVETYASDYALGAVLSQVNYSGKNPISFDSCRILPAELNFEINDKEPLGMVWALQSWRVSSFSLSILLSIDRQFFSSILYIFEIPY
ncbi:hypothetical protein O181_008559 [Austropuccinia psidii MF-1]|uniref:Reverse transcriptase/retrotransposon-derived protein RNase H-like domain-containing protein n=1 Tax=Austropuccinia psidii MF-1 TaxID=1389203 RepID=A0A9Q3BP35_9BASI|nr:hypothetical protein [Austropuccinia psidii MF-1]